MPLELQLGVTVPIPCRACGEAFVKFEIAPGRHTLKCPRCSEETHVAAVEEAEGWRIRTRDRRV